MGENDDDKQHNNINIDGNNNTALVLLIKQYQCLHTWWFFEHGLESWCRFHIVLNFCRDSLCGTAFFFVSMHAGVVSNKEVESLADTAAMYQSVQQWIDAIFWTLLESWIRIRMNASTLVIRMQIFGLKTGVAREWQLTKCMRCRQSTLNWNR